MVTYMQLHDVPTWPVMENGNKCLPEEKWNRYSDELSEWCQNLDEDMSHNIIQAAIGNTRYLEEKVTHLSKWQQHIDTEIAIGLAEMGSPMVGQIMEKEELYTTI